jgi:hypothetical protein
LGRLPTSAECVPHQVLEFINFAAHAQLEGQKLLFLYGLLE